VFLLCVCVGGDVVGYVMLMLDMNVGVSSMYIVVDVMSSRWLCGVGCGGCL